MAFVVTNVAAAMGALTWMTVSWIRHGHPSVLGAAAGAVAGLVGITPAAGFRQPGIGDRDRVRRRRLLLLRALSCSRRRSSVDDALDVFAVHGIGGIWGSIATGIFANFAINGIGSDGLIYGGFDQFVKQVVAVVASLAFAAAATFVILKVDRPGDWTARAGGG